MDGRPSRWTRALASLRRGRALSTSCSVARRARSALRIARWGSTITTRIGGCIAHLHVSVDGMSPG
jgi:hypothetical protein